MPAISEITRIKIKAYLEVFIDNLVEQHKSREIALLTDIPSYLAQQSRDGDLKPFHIALIPNEIMRLSTLERSFSTTLGTTYEECGKLIALEHHAEAHRAYDLTSEVSETALNEIERQASQFEHAADQDEIRPSLAEMMESVFDAQTKGTSKRQVTVRADLFVKSHDGTEYYFEIKSPKPNKGQCLEIMRRFLKFYLIREQIPPEVNVLFAMAYNPFGSSRKDYHWSIPQIYLPFDDTVVIGHEFWNIIGGETAFEELLSIYQEVGKEKAKYIIDNILYGF